MSNLKFTTSWQASDNGDAIDRDTSAQLSIQLDTHFLTKNEDVWSQTVRDSIFVSTYPLAQWFASSWWRLNYETLPVFVNNDVRFFMQQASWFPVDLH